MSFSAENRLHIWRFQEKSKMLHEYFVRENAIYVQIDLGGFQTHIFLQNHLN